MRTLILINVLFLSYKLSELSNDIHRPRSDNFVNTTKIDSIPVWVRQLYETNNDEFLNDAVPTVIFFKKLSDSISYCLFEVNDGVCQITFVATQKNNKKYKRFKIGNECDEDFANPVYSRTFYEHDSVKISVKVTTEVEKAKSKYLIKDNGGSHFKDGYNMENAETINYSINKAILISHSGNIIAKINNSH